MEAWKKSEIQTAWNPVVRFVRGDNPQGLFLLAAYTIIALIVGIFDATFSGDGPWLLDVMAMVLFCALSLHGLLSIYLGFLTWVTLRYLFTRRKLSFERRVGFDIFGAVLVGFAFWSIGRAAVYSIPEIGPEAVRKFDAVTEY